MSHVFLDRRGGRLALYLHGELQFDAADERLYHEPLGLVPTALAAARHPGRGLRVLVLGGGDGLALREVLRVGAVREAHLVDHDPAVLALARGDLAELNRFALADPRVSVHALDARAFLEDARGFDVVIADLTYPRDLAGARLLDTRLFAAVRVAMRPRGIVAVNGVSPELTPSAFGCLAATLIAAGLSAIPYAFVLPSFAAEGYGRWGFLYASSDGIADEELVHLALPADACVSGERVRAGGLLPASAAGLMGVAPNHRDELLFHVWNSPPLTWAPPFRPLRFTGAVPTAGPRLTVAHGFAEWLRQPRGASSLDELLRCLPLAQRGHTRELVLEWSHHAEAFYRELELGALAERIAARAAMLPQAWARELTAFSARVRDGVPPLRELLEPAYRVFAVFLLVLLTANLLFPDNLYAKGGGHVSSSSGGGPAVHFSDPLGGPGPFRHRSYSGLTPGGGWQPWVRSVDGRQHPSQPISVTDDRGHRAVRELLALTPEVRLLDTGVMAYAASVPGYGFVLEPNRLGVIDPQGRELFALLPGPGLRAQVVGALATQAPLIGKAITDHRRWLEWTSWGAWLPAGHEASAELDELERIKHAFALALAVWNGAPPAPSTAVDPRWQPLFPGVWMDPDPPGKGSIVFVSPLGTDHRRPLEPAGALTDQDRLAFWLLYRKLLASGDPGVASLVERWRQVHGAALGVAARPPAGGPASPRPGGG